jgi:hypothetical protein
MIIPVSPTTTQESGKSFPYTYTLLAPLLDLSCGVIPVSIKGELDAAWMPIGSRQDRVEALRTLGECGLASVLSHAMNYRTATKALTLITFSCDHAVRGSPLTQPATSTTGIQIVGERLGDERVLALMGIVDAALMHS